MKLSVLVYFLLILLLSEPIWALVDECSKWLEAAGASGVEAEKIGRSGEPTGNNFLKEQGIYLSLFKNASSELKPGGAFEFTVVNCAACKEGMKSWPACSKSVSLYARLVGPDGLLRFVDVLPKEGSEKGGEAGATRHTITGTIPPISGDYILEVKVRWYNGLADVKSASGERPVFLGSEGRKKYHDKGWMSGPMWSKFRQNGGPGRWQEVEDGCILRGSPLAITVAGDATPRPGTELCKKEDMLSGKLSGYWEKWPADRPEGGLFGTVIKDGANPNLMYRLDTCTLPIFNQGDVTRRFQAGKAISLHVFGDSLAQEVGYNAKHHYMSRLRVDTHEKELNKVCVSSNRATLSRPGSGHKVIIVENLRIAHKIWHTPVEEFKRQVDEYVTNYEKYIKNCFGASPSNVIGIFYGGYPLHNQRDIPVKEQEEYWITRDRMRLYDKIAWERLSKLPNWYYQDNRRALDPYVEASWDGFHFLQVMNKIGGASKLMTAITLNIAFAALGTL